MTGADLKRRRLALGMTQQQLADRWGLPQTTISKWETGRWKMQHDRIIGDALAYLERHKVKGKRISDHNGRGELDSSL